MFMFCTYMYVVAKYVLFVVQNLHGYETQFFFQFKQQIEAFSPACGCNENL